MLNSALREKFSCYFSKFFASINKIFIFAGRLGAGGLGAGGGWALGYHSIGFRHFPNIS